MKKCEGCGGVVPKQGYCFEKTSHKHWCSIECLLDVKFSSDENIDKVIAELNAKKILEIE